MIEPVDDRADHAFFVGCDGVEKPPSLRKIVLPQIVDAVLESVGFRDEPFRDLRAAERILFESSDRSYERSTQYGVR